MLNVRVFGRDLGKWALVVWIVSLAGGMASPSMARSEAAPPVLELHDRRGIGRSLESLRGKIVVLNFWATWCVPCREEMPMLARLHAYFAPRGVAFVGASADDETTRVHIPALLAESGVRYPIWVGATRLDMARFELGEALPATAILDRDGYVAFRLIGPLGERAIARRVEWLLGQRRGSAPAALVDTFGTTEGESHATRDHVHDDGEREESTEHRHAAVEGRSDHPSGESKVHAHGSNPGEASLVPS